MADGGASRRKILEVVDLTIQFDTAGKTVTAVDGISFTLYSGETLGIVGESGSGKSVTSLALMRLIASPPGRIAKGQILFYPKEGEAVDLLQLSESEMRRFRGAELAMIFQEPTTSLNPVFSCGDQVLEAILAHRDISRKEARKRVLFLFGQVKLPDPERAYRSYPHQLSGGQKQRVMIAMAISCNPGILIADEPTTALDATVQKHILELMKELRQTLDISVIFITHDLGVIAEIADSVLVLHKGVVVEQGNVEDIFRNPQHPYTKSLLACRPPLNHRLKRLPVVKDFMEIIEEPDGKHTILAKKSSVGEAIEERIIPSAETVRRLRELEASIPILQVRDLRAWFPAKKNWLGKPIEFVKAVDGVSFDVYPGETLGLVGESGCGKTTLGRTILGLTPAISGEAFFEGQNLLTFKNEALIKMRKNVQIIFQDPYSSLNPRMTIGSAIMEPMQVHGLYENNRRRKEKVVELLEMVSLEAAHFNRYPHEFSGGQRQRICIARALALEPKFIICDESVSALDVSVQAQVLNLLIDLRNKMQFTCIFISHDLSVVKFISDRMAVMNKGKIEEIGPSDQIYNHPASEYTQKLIAAIPKGINY